jgi:[acyl-carrier-protein] S-malonyltransferase
VANPDQEKVAWVFPGQGSQRVGMGRELTQLDPEIATLYATADDTLGFPLSEIIFDGPEATLQETSVQQPAILLTSIAYLRALQYRGLLPDADYVAGHSLGEYAAMVAAGSLDFQDALRLVRRRGELMQEHGAGAMAAILGLAAEDVTAIARDAGVEVANFNTPVQTTVSGRVAAVERAIALAKERGAKRALLLPVSGAFHSTLMAPVADAMRLLIDNTTIQAGRVPLVADVDARFLTDPSDLRNELVDQICGSVRWVDVVGALVGAGVTTFYEIGPGQVLAGLIGRCVPEATVFTAERMVAVAVTAVETR